MISIILLQFWANELQQYKSITFEVHKITKIHQICPWSRKYRKHTRLHWRLYMLYTYISTCTSTKAAITNFLLWYSNEYHMCTSHSYQTGTSQSSQSKQLNILTYKHCQIISDEISKTEKIGQICKAASLKLKKNFPIHGISDEHL